MPTDGLSLLLSLGLLLPGFAFSIARRRHRPVESRSAFRETTTAVFISVLADGLLLTTVLLTCLLAEGFRHAVVEIVSDAPRSVARHPFAWWLGTVGFLLLSTVLGALLGIERVQAITDRVMRRKTSTTGSSWHWVFKDAVPEGTKVILITAELVDGGWVRGVLSSWDRSATDVPDRGIVLAGSISRRTSGTAPFVAVDDASAVVLTDRNIRSMQVTHLAETWPSVADPPGSAEAL